MSILESSARMQKIVDNFCLTSGNVKTQRLREVCCLADDIHLD